MQEVSGSIPLGSTSLRAVCAHALIALRGGGFRRVALLPGLTAKKNPISFAHALIALRGGGFRRVALLPGLTAKKKPISFAHALIALRGAIAGSLCSRA
jgi:hypothetical protein